MKRNLREKRKLESAEFIIPLSIFDFFFNPYLLSSSNDSFMEEAQKRADVFLQERISEINMNERAQHSKTLEQRELLLKENAVLQREKYDLGGICSGVMTDLKKVKHENLDHEHVRH